MTTHIALLRAINVGGRKPVAMPELRDFVTKLGFGEVQSLLQTGNLVFEGGARTGRALERLLETKAKELLELETDFFVRTAKEWEAIIAGNPFEAEAKRDPSHLVVLLLKAAPDPKSVEALRAAITGREIIHADGRHAYVVYPDGIGRSRLTVALIEKKLGSRTTGRNWNTVLKLGALAGA